jgi:hypothetical protein
MSKGAHIHMAWMPLALGELAQLILIGLAKDVWLNALCPSQLRFRISIRVAKGSLSEWVAHSGVRRSIVGSP